MPEETRLKSSGSGQSPAPKPPGLRPTILDVRRLARDLLEVDLEGMCDMASHGEYKFADLLGDARCIRGMVSRLAEAPLSEVPDSTLVAISASLRTLREHSLQNVNFNPATVHNVANTRQQLVSNWKGIASNLVTQYAQAAAIARNAAIDIDAEAKLLEERMADFDAQSQSALAEVKKVLEDATHAAALTAVVRYSGVFATAEAGHRKFGHVWLGVTAVLFVILGYLVIHFFVLVPPGVVTSSAAISSPGSNGGPATVASTTYINQVVARVAVLALGFVVVGIASRNYKVHRHLEVVNGHRSRALNTFEAFSKEAKDGQTKDAVLLEAAKCVFSRGSSGYLSAEPDSGLKVVEVLKAARGG